MVGVAGEDAPSVVMRALVGRLPAVVPGLPDFVFGAEALQRRSTHRIRYSVRPLPHHSLLRVLHFGRVGSLLGRLSARPSPILKTWSVSGEYNTHADVIIVVVVVVDAFVVVVHV